MIGMRRIDQWVYNVRVYTDVYIKSTVVRNAGNTLNSALCMTTTHKYADYSINTTIHTANTANTGINTQSSPIMPSIQPIISFVCHPPQTSSPFTRSR